MFQTNLSTSASNTEGSFFDNFDAENPKNLANPLVKMPLGHNNYTEADKERCPVMSGKIKPPVEEVDEEEYDSDSSDEEETETLMPKGHEGYSQKDKENCPVMSGKVPFPENGQENGLKKKKKRKLQSGCPFMPSENKKAPALAHLEPSYEIPYISTLRHLFTFKGLLPKGKTAAENRKNFDKYPIFLKHTLFHKEGVFDRVRKMEMSQKFFVYDKFREQGNKKYHKNPQEAISYYEHALSCLKWLEIKKDDHKDFEEIKEDDPLAKLKPMTRALATVLNDDNVELHDGENLTESNDVDMRNSMLLNVYLGFACSYLKLNHYGAAIVAVDEGLKLSDSSSQLYFRRSQARAYNKGATLEDLYKAKDDIEKAIEVKHHEKLFQQDSGILKIMNVHNAGEIYVEHAHFVEKLIKEKKDQIKTAMKPFFSRVKELEYIEEAMTKENGDNEDEHTVEIVEKNELEEMEIIKEMLNKYYKIIEFNLETEKKEQVQIARQELQSVLETYTKMKLLLNLDFKNYQNNPLVEEAAKDFDIDLSNPKTQKRLEKFKMGKARDIFENGHFNMQVFQYAAKDHLKKKEEKEKKKKDLKKHHEAIKPKNKWSVTIFGVEIGIHMIVLLLLFGLFVFYQKGSFGPTIASRAK